MIKLRNCLIALILLLSLTGCNDVFYSAVSGRLIDQDTEAGIPGVNVYAYTSAEERNRAYDAWTPGTLFTDNSCKFRTTTDASGSFSISKVIWTTNKPAWGEDYDSSDIYLIFFSEEYGLIKEGPIAVISSSSNQSAVTLKLERQEEASVLDINFRDISSAGSSRNADGAINFKYSYSNGYRKITRDASTSNGTFSINVSYPKGQSAEVKIESISSPLGIWSATAESFTFTVDEPSAIEYVDMKRSKFNLGDGIYGNILLPPADFEKLNTAEVFVTVDGIEYVAKCTDISFVGPEDAPTHATASYSALAGGVLIDAEYDADGALVEESLVITLKDKEGNVLATNTLKLSAASAQLECNLN